MSWGFGSVVRGRLEYRPGLPMCSRVERGFNFSCERVVSCLGLFGGDGNCLRPLRCRVRVASTRTNARRPGWGLRVQTQGRRRQGAGGTACGRAYQETIERQAQRGEGSLTEKRKEHSWSFPIRVDKYWHHIGELSEGRR